MFKHRFLMFLDPNRRVLCIEGNDRYRFLNGLITQDIKSLEKGESSAIYTALLSPSGRYQFDFFVVSDQERLWIVAAHGQELLTRIQPYKLRLNVNLIPLFDQTYVYGSSTFFSEGISFKDPRHPSLGYWCIGDRYLAETTGYKEYTDHRFSLGIPDSQDFEKDRSIILEWGLEELNGISFTKGCYMGQELMSRTKHIGQIRKRLMPCQFETIVEPAKKGDAVIYDKEVIGEVKATHGNAALVLVRIDMLPIRENDTISVAIGLNKATIHKPEWIKYNI